MHTHTHTRTQAAGRALCVLPLRHLCFGNVHQTKGDLGVKKRQHPLQEMGFVCTEQGILLIILTVLPLTLSPLSLSTTTLLSVARGASQLRVFTINFFYYFKRLCFIMCVLNIIRARKQ